MRIVMIRYFAFKWFEITDGKNLGVVTKLAFEDALLPAVNYSCDFAILMKSGNQTLQEIVAILYGHPASHGDASKLLVQHNFNGEFFTE